MAIILNIIAASSALVCLILTISIWRYLHFFRKELLSITIRMEEALRIGIYDRTEIQRWITRAWKLLATKPPRLAVGMYKLQNVFHTRKRYLNDMKDTPISSSDGYGDDR